MGDFGDLGMAAIDAGVDYRVGAGVVLCWDL